MMSIEKRMKWGQRMGSSKNGVRSLKRMEKNGVKWKRKNEKEWKKNEEWGQRMKNGRMGRIAKSLFA